MEALACSKSKALVESSVQKDVISISESQVGITTASANWFKEASTRRGLEHIGGAARRASTGGVFQSKSAFQDRMYTSHRISGANQNIGISDILPRPKTTGEPLDRLMASNPSLQDSFHADSLMMFEKSSSSLAVTSHSNVAITENSRLSSMNRFKSQPHFSHSQRLAALKEAEGLVEGEEMHFSLSQSMANFSIGVPSDLSTDAITIFTDGSYQVSTMSPVKLDKRVLNSTRTSLQEHLSTNIDTSLKIIGEKDDNTIDDDSTDKTLVIDEYGFPVQNTVVPASPSRILCQDARWEGKSRGIVSRLVFNSKKFGNEINPRRGRQNSNKGRIRKRSLDLESDNLGASIRSRSVSSSESSGTSESVEIASRTLIDRWGTEISVEKPKQPRRYSRSDTVVPATKLEGSPFISIKSSQDKPLSDLLQKSRLLREQDS